MKLLKPITTAVLLIALQMSTSAQETPSGKKFAESFWKAIAEEKQNAAQNALESIKRREPGFDASKMEKALAEMTSKKQNALDTAKNESNMKIAVGKSIGQLFGGSFRITGKTQNGEVLSFIEERKRMVQEILSVDRKLIQSDLDSAANRLRSSTSVDSRRVVELVKRIDESVEAASVELVFFDLLLKQSFWDSARKVYPDESEFAAVYNSISTSINRLGTPQERAAVAVKNLEVKIDAERLSRSPIKDAKIEKWFKDTFTDASAMRSRNYTFLRVVVLNNDYDIKRNPISGLVTGRTRGADIAFKKADGKCYHGIYIISQEFVGGSFTGATLSPDFDQREMRCTNVNK